VESQKFVSEGLSEMHKNFQTSEDLVNKQLSRWYHLHIWLQVVSVALGIVAAVAIALQTDVNVWLTKPVGLISAILSGGIVTIYNVFHIRATLDELLDIQSEVLLHTNEIDTFIRRNKIEAGASDLLEIEDKYALILNNLGRRRRSVMGSVGTMWKNKATLGTGMSPSTKSSFSADDPMAVIRPQRAINRPH
jgi:hypothetical protein